MTVELKQKAKNFVEEYLRDNLIVDEEVLVQFATETTKELQEENKELNLKISRLESYCDAYEYSQRTYQEEIKELEGQVTRAFEVLEGKRKRIEELEAQIEELKKQKEKMKNCNNCGNYYTESCKGCEDYCHWKLKE